MIQSPSRRLLARRGSLAGAALSATAIMASVFGAPYAQAAEAAGSAMVVKGEGRGAGVDLIESGEASTPFQLVLPKGAACTGDSETGEYRVQSFLVDASVDLDELMYNADGPVTPNGEFALPLLVGEETYIMKATQKAEKPGDEGVIINLPVFSFGAVPGAMIPQGQYRVGIACTLLLQRLDRYWSAPFEIVVDGTGANAKMSWRAPAPDQSTSTTSSTTAPTSTTLVDGGTTTSTTVADGTETTTSTTSVTDPDGTTTTTVAGAGATSTTRPGGAQPSTSVTGSVGGLARTGSSLLPPVAWGVLLLAFGRAAVLLSRPVRVRNDGR